MKKIVAFFLVLQYFAFASEKYGVYDLQGNRISTFEAEQHELLEKTHQIKVIQPNRNLYVSSLVKGKSSKPSFSYRYKAETGAYIEASRKETFSICPEKEIQGIWISEHSVSLNKENCLSVQVPNLAGTFYVLFLQNSGRTDTIQILVEQSYIQMGDYVHQIWIPDSMPQRCLARPGTCEFPAYGHYESRKYSQFIIVDKTKFTIGDAQHYSEIGNIKLGDIEYLKEFAKSEKIDLSKLPFTADAYEAWRFANERSKSEGLDTAYHIVDMHRDNSKNTGKLVIFGNPDINPSDTYLAIDTSAFGYRLPFDDEWLFLMRAGASTRYFWGDDEDSLTVSRYAWYRPLGFRPVAQLLPNQFGLYDMVGNADELVDGSFRNLYIYNYIEHNFYSQYAHRGLYTSCNFLDIRALSPECDFIRKTGALGPQYKKKNSVSKTCVFVESGKTEKCVSVPRKKIKSADTWVPQRLGATGFRYVRKTPKLHKLDRF